MFIPALIGLASKEQQAKWLTLAQNLSIIGTYAQTELGHGTFIRGLETTATYDSSSEEFIVHTPTLSGTKWWPGGLGKTATHVVLMARLFVHGQDYGPHAFIVQVRSIDTHRPLPGITVGDIGPKFGYNGVDNGFLSFDHVRIPREHMLMRFAKVTPEGKYIHPPPSNSKASYVTMLYVRANIVVDAGRALAKAVTIAVRYCCVRRQTSTHPGMQETKVIDYQNVGACLIPFTAIAFAFHFTGIHQMHLYKEFEKGRDRSDFRILPELHVQASVLKAICTWEAVEGIEQCRFRCGGHGYSRLSGLPDLYASFVQNATWEGDNDVLCLQTGRFLLKAMAGLPGKKIEGAANYLQSYKDGSLPRRCPVAKIEDWKNLETCLTAFRFCVAFLCEETIKAIQTETGGKLVFEGNEWNKNTVPVIQCACVHGWYIVLSNFYEFLHHASVQSELPTSTLSVLHQCALLTGLTKIEKYASHLLEAKYITPEQIKMARAQKNASIMDLRSNIVPLVDSFGYLDYELNSALGRYDGDVYRGLLEMAKASPLNRTEEGPAWKPVLQHRLQPDAKL